MILNEQWHRVYKKLALLIEGNKVASVSEAAQELGISRATLNERLRSDFGVSAATLSTFPEILDNAVHQEGKVIEAIFEDKSGNSWAIDALDRRIKTLADLIAVCKIDLRIWEVERHIVNKWEFGVADRNAKDGSATIHPLFQVKAWLMRKEPIAIKPVIKPIEVSVRLPKPKKTNNKIKRALVIQDIQAGFRKNLNTGALIPFHDRRVLDLSLQILQYQKFDDVTFMGDDLDLSEWSTRWQVEPEFYHTTQAVIIEMHWWLSQFRQAAPDASMDMLDGNHNRFNDAIVAHLRSAYQLRPADELHRDAILTMPRMLALDKLHINYIDGYSSGTSKKWLNDLIVQVHGDIAQAGPGRTAGAQAQKNNSTVVFAHSHRRELASKTIVLRDGRIVTAAFSPGCACHVDGRVPGSKEDSQWQQGIGVIEYSDEYHHLIPIEINDGVAIYDGRIFTARNRDADAEAKIRDGLNQVA